MVEPTEKITDIRLEFIKEYCTRSLRVKPEKWDRIMISDEQRSFIMGFIERQTPQVSIIRKCQYSIILGLFKMVVWEATLFKKVLIHGYVL